MHQAGQGQACTACYSGSAVFHSSGCLATTSSPKAHPLTSPTSQRASSSHLTSPFSFSGRKARNDDGSSPHIPLTWIPYPWQQMAPNPRPDQHSSSPWISGTRLTLLPTPNRPRSNPHTGSGAISHKALSSRPRFPICLMGR